MGWADGRYIGKNTSNNQVDTSAVASNGDGSILERLEWVQTALGGAAGQLRVTQSASTTVEENAIIQFNIGVFDVDAGAVASASIDITGITNVLQKSTGGGAFATGTITQPTFSKADGSVYCAYQFLAAEWQAGDMYKLTVTGVTATINSDVAYVPDMIWSNLVVEMESLEDYVLAIPSSTGSNTWNATALAALQTEADDALVARDLDHVVNAADGGANKYPDSVVQDSIMAYILAKGDPALATSYDNTTDSLEAIRDRMDTLNVADQIDLDAILADTITISGGTLPVAPTVGSLATFVSGGSTALGQPLPASTSLVDIVGDFTGPYNGAAQDDNIKASLDLLHSATADTTVGKTQILEVSVTSAANAGAVTLATITTQPCLIKSIVVHADTASQTDLTSAAVTGGASNAVTFLSAADTAVANINAVDEQVAWTGAVRLAATKTIVMTLAGTGVTAVDLTVIIEYCACVDGGYLV